LLIRWILLSFGIGLKRVAVQSSPQVETTAVTARDSKNLVIMGAGGHAQVIIDAAQEQGIYNILGLVDQAEKPPGSLMGYEIKKQLSEFETCNFFVAIGDNRIRMRLFEDALAQGWTPATIIHPSASVSKHATIGAGTIICAGGIVGVNATVGSNSIINTGATIDHECRVGSHAHLAVGAHMAGNSRIEDGTFVGAGAVLIPGITIGSWSTVGAGAVVLGNITSGVTAVGLPARAIERAEKF
jgi:sugar O-acyltransferase (sialic acid O-acetyltransferase NeuD family)